MLRILAGNGCLPEFGVSPSTVTRSDFHISSTYVSLFSLGLFVKSPMDPFTPLARREFVI